MTLRAEAWSGWSRDHVPVKWAAQLLVRERTALCHASFDRADAARTHINDAGWAVWPVRIWPAKALFMYRQLTIAAPGGGSYSLLPPYEGRFYLNTGECIWLATPTMDAGTIVFLQLDGVQEDSSVPLSAEAD